ncbi:MAG: hypothetical protein AB1743_09535 [Actinomycetota bacterium]
MFCRFRLSAKAKIRVRRYVLIMAMSVLPFTIALAANIALASSAAMKNSEGDMMAKAFKAATPYITMLEDRTVSFNVGEAQRGGLDKASIDLIKDYVGLQNKSIKELAQGKSTTSVDKEIFDRFGPFFKRVATKGLGDIPASGDISILAEACGGSSDNPHPCPPRLNSGFYTSSRDKVVARLLYMGYHKTAGYACGDSPNDYSKVVAAYNCNNGPFRKQAIIYQSGTQWTYWTQEPEPNPEIFSYVWPAWWWGGYVRWWHSDFC